MRFLGIGDANELGHIYLRLAANGHEVRVHINDLDASEVLTGLCTRTPDWKAELGWIRDAGDEGIILFETVSQGDTQDALRREGFQVIGGSALGDRLETDRALGQQILRGVGLKTAPVHAFQSFEKGIEFVHQNPGRYVYKLNGTGFASSRNHVGEMPDGQDVIGLLKLERASCPEDIVPSFVLMQHVSGVEMGVGAYFNGERFLAPACVDWEHKRFFPGDLGELTGEMGTLVTFRGAEILFERTLSRMAGTLRAGGYVGYINLNCIVNEAGAWPLEFTCRFGHPGSAIMGALQAEGWDEIFGKMVSRRSAEIKTYTGYAVGVVLSVPPFPMAPVAKDRGPASARGLPIFFSPSLTDNDRTQLHYAEVALRSGQLVTSGPSGYVMVATGRGETAKAAQQAAYALCRKVVIPNVRYRNDIGDKFILQDEVMLHQLGYLE